MSQSILHLMQEEVWYLVCSQISTSSSQFYCFIRHNVESDGLGHTTSLTFHFTQKCIMISRPVFCQIHHTALRQFWLEQCASRIMYFKVWVNLILGNPTSTTSDEVDLMLHAPVSVVTRKIMQMQRRAVSTFFFPPFWYSLLLFCILFLHWLWINRLCLSLA